MIRAGSIVGLSVNYDVTAVAGSPSTVIQVVKNGAFVYGIALDETVQADTETYGTQVRGTDTFEAGDTVIVRLSNTGDFITFENIIANLEYVYDD